MRRDWVARINMVVALVIIAIFGFCLPIVLFVIMRRRMSEPNKGMGYGEMDRWLISEFGLDWRERQRVRRSVLNGDEMDVALEKPLSRPGGTRPGRPIPLPAAVAGRAGFSWHTPSPSPYS